MSQQDIIAIERQIERLKNRKAQVLAKDASAERRRRTRQNIIVGAWVQQHRPEMIEQVRASLNREQDRAVFLGARQPSAANVDINLPLDDDGSEACHA